MNIISSAAGNLLTITDQKEMKKQTLKQIKSSIRKKQIKDGFFDGRFVPKVQSNKKKQLNKKQCRLKVMLND